MSTDVPEAWCRRPVRRGFLREGRLARVAGAGVSDQHPRPPGRCQAQVDTASVKGERSESRSDPQGPWGTPGRPDNQAPGERARCQKGGEMAQVQRFARRWYTVSEVAGILGYGESKVRMAIISGDLRSIKDGRFRRDLPEWIDEYVERKVAEGQADD